MISYALALMLSSAELSERHAERRVIEGFAIQQGNMILLFDRARDAKAFDLDRCWNVAVEKGARLTASAVRQRKARLIVEDVGWPSNSAIPGAYVAYSVRGVRVDAWCSRKPLYWATNISVAR